MTIGWDNEGADYSNFDYMVSGLEAFGQSLRSAARQPFLIETADRANEWNATGFRPGYGYSQPSIDCAAMNQFLYIMYASPGITESAGSNWYTQISDISFECGQFTMRAIIFPDPAQLTIANLLSDNYTSGYITRRLTVDGTSFLSSLKSFYIKLNDVRLVENPMGVDGLTNSFAATIWVI